MVRGSLHMDSEVSALLSDQMNDLGVCGAPDKDQKYRMIESVIKSAFHPQSDIKSLLL